MCEVLWYEGENVWHCFEDWEEQGMLVWAQNARQCINFNAGGKGSQAQKEEA